MVYNVKVKIYNLRNKFVGQLRLAWLNGCYLYNPVGQSWIGILSAILRLFSSRLCQKIVNSASLFFDLLLGQFDSSDPKKVVVLYISTSLWKAYVSVVTRLKRHSLIQRYLLLPLVINIYVIWMMPICKCKILSYIY